MAAYNRLPDIVYNEFDEQAAAWLRELIRRGHIAPGEVDTRSIVDVSPDDLRGVTQFHAFAGIGVWSYAARRAGWPDDRPLWTGSPPCQPFSAAGKGLGVADERHLWPSYFHLIDVLRPEVCFGEQVASKDGLAWLDHVWADMEGAGYAFGANDLCAAGFGAPHIRQRQFFVGTRTLVDPFGARLEGHGRHGDNRGQPGWVGTVEGRPVAEAGADGRLSLSDDAFWRANLARGDLDDRTDAGWSEDSGDAGTGVAGGGVADAGRASTGSGPTNGHWGDADWLLCRDGKWRPVEPGTFPLAHGAPARVGRLRGYGNAIVAQVAEGFIRSYLEAEADGFSERQLGPVPLGSRLVADDLLELLG